MSDTEIQSFRRLNARAHVIVKDGETVAYSWLVPDSRYIFDWIQVVLAPGELYSSGAFVAHSYRGQRLQGELRKFGWSQVANENYGRVVTFIERLNRSSLKSQVKPARRYVGRLTYLRLLGLVIYNLDGNWGIGFWNRRNPFKLSFDIFDRSVSRPPKGTIRIKYAQMIQNTIS